MAKENEENFDLELWRAGDEGAAKELYDKFVDQLVGLARQRISQRFASRVDAEDIVQSVFRTFFHRAREGQFEVRDQDDICKLLVRITIHKTLRQIAHHRRAKRDARMEMGQGESNQEYLQSMLNGDPSPEDAIVLLDELEHFLSQLTPEDRQILEMRMEGYTTSDISKKLNINDRRIRRLMERIRSLAKKEGLG